MPKPPSPSAVDPVGAVDDGVRSFRRAAIRRCIDHSCRVTLAFREVEDRRACRGEPSPPRAIGLTRDRDDDHWMSYRPATSAAARILARSLRNTLVQIDAAPVGRPHDQTRRAAPAQREVHTWVVVSFDAPPRASSRDVVRLADGERVPCHAGAVATVTGVRPRGCPSTVTAASRRVRSVTRMFATVARVSRNVR